jgi:signal transduction histidine kinase
VINRSVRAKLAFGITALSIAIVVAVGTTLTVVHTKHLETELRRKGEIYAKLLSRQLQTVVAFDDHQTARELFDSMSFDVDLVGAAVYDSRGDLIEGHGDVVSRVVGSIRSLPTRPTSITFVAEVDSPEGRLGSVMVRLSTIRLDGERSASIITLLIVAAIATSIAFVLAMIFARTVTRRLERIADAAGRLAGGDLSEPALESNPPDEVGRLALAFNTMVQDLRASLDERQRVAEGRAHAQKLESVGRLASGVAHEINTPVQFVSDSITFVRESLAALLPVLHPEIHDPDLEYVYNEVPKALDLALDGLSRVATIVRSMKAYTHPDTESDAPTDLNHAVQTTLTIARSEFRHVADLETNFGDLPLVSCNAGEINQVVLNIVLNAAHAIGDQVNGSGQRGRLTVATRRDGDHAVIEIGDTGGGIPDHVRHRIFDPFFTTKDVGKGTGQGLALAHSVIEKHRGTLTFETAPGQTTFFVRLPLS